MSTSGADAADQRHSGMGASSSPMRFPSSSIAAENPASAARGHNRQQGNNRSGPTSSSPLRFPSSSGDTIREPRRTQNSVLSSEPLFFPTSSNRGTPRARQPPNRRGDIHSTVPSALSSVLASRARLGSSDAPPGVSASDRLSNPVSLSSHLQPTPEERTVIWGTLVSLPESMQNFRKFLLNFKRKYRMAYDLNVPVEEVAGQDGAEDLVYVDYMRTMRLTSQCNLNLDLNNLLAYPPSKNQYRKIMCYPQELIPIFDQVLKDCVIDIAEEDREAGAPELQGINGEDEIAYLETRVFKVRPFGIGSQAVKDTPDDHSVRCGANMRNLNPGDIDKLVSIKGLVIRATPIIPDMKKAFFRCLSCGHAMTVEIDRGKISEPNQCPRDVCSQPGGMSLVHNRCEFADRQVVRLQETPDEVPDGQTPHTVSLCVYDELVDVSKPGDRVEVTGIFRSVPVRVNPRQRVIKTLFKTYVDVLHVKRSNSRRLGVDLSTRGGEGRMGRGVIGVGGEDEEEESATNAELEIQDNLIGRSGTGYRTRAELEEKMVELSGRPDIYNILARSLAPSVWEMDDIKKGILLQLFGGTNKTIGRGGGAGGPRYRGDINVLLVGDPGVSKSQILQYVHKIAPRGVYTSGKGSSAVGLTAYVTRDPDSRQLVLESGALVLSDGGVCCIDEFDKMSDSTRSVLHEVMEQQTVSIAKAGIITTLNARTSILAAANPVGSKYNLSWPITKNIDLPPTLISRFDLLYLVLDKIDEVSDRRLAKHLVGLYLEDRPPTGGNDILPVQTLTSYISFARNRIHPTLTQDACTSLVQAYISMRKAGEDSRTSERRITATTRQLESMIRLSEAHARMRFSETVDMQDVEEASRLIREALKESATDPVTGLIDLDLLQTGQGQHQRKLLEDLKRELAILLSSAKFQGGVRWSELYDLAESQSSIPIDTSDFAEVIKTLAAEGQIAITGEREKRIIVPTM